MKSVNLNLIWLSVSVDLRSFILYKTGNKEDTEDILHEVFIKIHDKINTLKDQDKIIPWIYRITHNLIIDYFRQKKAKERVDYKDLALTDKSVPENFMREAIKDMINFLDDLPEESCEAICKTELEGLSQKEYAELKGLSYSGAKSRVQRARQMLKDLLMKCCHYEFDKYGTIIKISPNRDCCCCK